MSRKNDNAVVDRVKARIDEAIEKNAEQERIIIGLLLAMFALGMGLIVYAAASGRWGYVILGGLLQFFVVFPINRIIQLRAENLRLQILPELMQMADGAEAKALAAKLVHRLIEQVKS